MSDDNPQPLTEIAAGFRRRTLKTVRLATKMGLQMSRKMLSLDDLARKVDEQDAVKAANELLEQLDGLKGLLMKFGQMASYLSPSLPLKARQVLARLQAESRPMAYEQIAEVVEQDLGRSPEALFDSFDKEPFAAASIGQVHRATLDGRELAVKVQYPGVDKLMEADFRTVRRIAHLFFMMSSIDAKALMDELSDRVRQECDYLAEAHNQRLFRRLMSGPQVTVPDVVDERCSRHVLTSELVHATGFNTFSARAPQEQKDRAAAIIYETAFTCIFNHCVYNADPHPGNYLFGDDGTVAFIDFGCVKRFEVDFIERWKRLALTVMNGDRARFKEAVDATGVVARPKRFDYDHYWKIMQYIYQPFLSTEPFTFTHDYVRQSFDLLLFKNPNRFRTAIPPDWLFVNRLQWGLNSVLACLNATGPWPELFLKIIDKPTVPRS